MVSTPIVSCALPVIKINRISAVKSDLILTNLAKNGLFIVNFTIPGKLKNVLKYVLVFLFVLILQTIGKSNHIIGGEMYYDYLGSNKYRVTLKIYRDCDNPNSPNFDGFAQMPTAFLNVMDTASNQIAQIDLGLPVVTLVQGSINNPCIKTNVPCVEEGIYTTTITLPPLAGGYYLVYQRCCRNVGIDNLSNSNSQGASYFAYIPGPELATVNSCPRFNNFPPIDICNNLALNFDHSATDPDGDQLIYKFSEAFQGLDACCAVLGQNPPGNTCGNPPPFCPTFATPLPYPSVIYQSPYSKNYAVASNPSLTIDPTTGLLQGKPNLLGKYVVGVCVEEWRNGNLLSKHYRDFQFNIKTCTVTIVAAIADQSQLCQGLTINFTNQSINQSISPTYVWNFGDPNTLADTSRIKDPTYNYQDTGIYNVTLIVNPGALCSDTIKKQVYVYPPLSINFTKPQIACIKSNSVNFKAGGVFLPQCTFNWNFTSFATPNTSTLTNPQNINFTEPGVHYISLIAKQFACIDTFIDSITILKRPIAKINNFPTTLCDPGKVAFSNGSVSEYPPGYLWQTSDGFTYNSYEPTHVFTPSGIYTVTLTLLRGAPCVDTSKAVFSPITINPNPVADYLFSPTITTIFEPDIQFTNNSSTDVVSLTYEFGDGSASNNFNPLHTFQLPGKYLVTQNVTNNFGCTNKTEKTITILPEFRCWVPNSFTPDYNNKNDVFLPIVIGVTDYKFYVFDRWGEQLFYTNDPLKGWDGKRKGILCKQDVYVWKISFRNDVTQEFEVRTGQLNLLNPLNNE
jgi:gliding motility-associated-like protein